MPISLIRNTKDNAMHGSDNDRTTGCRLKLQGGTWYTREGELKDITDLTCDRCKEVFATKMIRESNKEELRIAKEEKKRYQRAKKQGIVREATYEEYLMNREAEASAKRDKRDDSATSASLQMLKNSIPAEQPVQQPAASVQFDSPFNPYNNQTQTVPPQNQFNPYAQQSTVTAPQAPFDPYAQQSTVTAPQAPFDPYAQQSTVTAPQAPFDPYAQQSTVTAPQSMFDPYAQQSTVTAPQSMFDPYAQQSTVTAPQSMFDPYAQQSGMSQGDTAQFEVPQMNSMQSETPSFDDGPAPSYQEYTRGYDSQNDTTKETASNSSSDDDFLAQFMVKPAPQTVETPAPSSNVTADNIVNATDDILSQFNIGSQLAESSPVTPVSEIKADASSFFSNNIPVVGAEYAGASSVNSAVTEFGSLNIVETPKDDFVVPDVPVYQPSDSNNYASVNHVVKPSSSLDDLTVPDISSLSPAQSASNVSLQFAELASADMNQSNVNDIEDAADIESDFGFDSLASDTPVSNDFSDDLMSGFGDIPAVPTLNSFESAPVAEPSVSVMNSFESVTPVQPVTPAINSFESVAPAQPAVPEFNSFEPAAPVQPTAPAFNSFEPAAPVQPTAPAFNGFEPAAPVQPAAPEFNSFEPAAPVQPTAPAFNSFEPVAPAQPAAPAFNNFEPAAPVQPAPSVPQNNPYAMPQNNYAQPNMYQQPAANTYQNQFNNVPQNNGFQMSQGYGAPVQQPQFTKPAAPAPAPAQRPAPVFAEQGNTADSIEEALRQLGADIGVSSNSANNQMPEKEEIMPDFVAYVPSSSKVLHSAPPASSASSNVPKRPISAREAKQLAKIDAKFKKDLISRGFNPNEIKNQRRGK